MYFLGKKFEDGKSETNPYAWRCTKNKVIKNAVGLVKEEEKRASRSISRLSHLNV